MPFLGALILGGNGVLLSMGNNSHTPSPILYLLKITSRETYEIGFEDRGISTASVQEWRVLSCEYSRVKSSEFYVHDDTVERVDIWRHNATHSALF